MADEPVRLVLPEALAKRSLAWVLDDTRGFHVSTLDDEAREALLNRLFLAVLQLEPALERILPELVRLELEAKAAAETEP